VTNIKLTLKIHLLKHHVSMLRSIEIFNRNDHKYGLEILRDKAWRRYVIDKEDRLWQGSPIRPKVTRISITCQYRWVKGVN